MARWTPKLIPKTTFQGRHQTQVVDSFGLITKSTSNFTLENASQQPLEGREQDTLPSGYRDSEMYKVYTTTEVRPATEGTDNLADQIDLVRENGEVITTEVVKVRDWHYNIQGHYLAFVVKINER